MSASPPVYVNQKRLSRVMIFSHGVNKPPPQFIDMESSDYPLSSINKRLPSYLVSYQTTMLLFLKEPLSALVLLTTVTKSVV